METTHIISIPFETSNNGSSSSKTEAKTTPDLLLSISSQAQRTSTSTLPDLTLQGTEGSVVVAGHIYSSRLSKILASDADISLQEFEQTLRRILLQRPPKSTTEIQDEDDLGISAVAAWTNDSGSASRQTGIRLRFRRTIGGIVRYMGEVALRRDDNLEVDVLEWARTAVARGMQMEAENAKVQVRLAEAEEGLAQMRTQMEEFVRVKRQDEEGLMSCFVKLLNEKKRKIREMQMAAGGYDRPWPEVPEEEEQEIKEEDAASVIGHRGGKRGRGRGRGVARGTTSQRGRKRKQEDVRTESRLASEDEQNGEDAEIQQEDGMETDRESGEQLSDIAETDQDVDMAAELDQDVDMSAESDDLDGPSRPQQAVANSRQTRTKSSQAAKGASNKTGPGKQKASEKQHALRARKPSPASSENEETTDDEL